MAEHSAQLLCDIIDDLGHVSGPDNNGWYTTLCPFHNDQHHPNLRFNTNGFRCMACGQKGSLRDLASMLGLENAVRLTGLELVELAVSKGIPESFLRSLGVTQGFTGFPSQRRPCVDIPFIDEIGQVSAVQKRLSLTDSPRFKWRRGDHPIPYGLWRLNEAKEKGYVVIIEGPSDAWTLWFNNFPALALPGAYTWKAEYAQFLFGLTVYLWVEQDAGGEALFEAISKSLPDVRIIKSIEGIKDPSELYLSNKELFKEAFLELITNARPASEIYLETRSKELEFLTKQTRQLAEDPHLIDRLNKAISSRGYAGDTRPAVCTYISITSGLLDQPLNIIFVAQSGSGKNASIDYVLPLFPENSYVVVKASSPLALVYSDEDFAHKIVILWESDSIPEEGPAASAIRSLMSDQRLEYQVVEKNESGHQTVRNVVKDGPTGIITTSTRLLKEQASTRMLTVPIPDTPEQTRAILQSIAKKESRASQSLDSADWVAFQKWLALTEFKGVIVPFAGRLAELLPSDAVRVRRDFSQVLTVIKVFALLHQAQREKDTNGFIIANSRDYELTRWLLEDIFSTSISGGITPAIRETVELVNEIYQPGQPVSLSQITDHLKLSKSTVSYRVNRAISGGWLSNKSKQRGSAAQIEPGLPMPDCNKLPPVDSLFVGEIPPENRSNTQTLGVKSAVASSESPQKVFESQFEHSPEADSELENLKIEEGVRVFELKPKQNTHTIKRPLETNSDVWETEL